MEIDNPEAKGEVGSNAAILRKFFYIMAFITVSYQLIGSARTVQVCSA